MYIYTILNIRRNVRNASRRTHTRDAQIHTKTRVCLCVFVSTPHKYLDIHTMYTHLYALIMFVRVLCVLTCIHVHLYDILVCCYYLFVFLYFCSSPFHPVTGQSVLEGSRSGRIIRTCIQCILASGCAEMAAVI